MAVQSNLCHNCYAIETEENWCYPTFLSWFYGVEKHRNATVALPARTVAPPCCTVSAPWWTGDQPASCFLENRGYTGVTSARWERNLFFYQMCPGASRYTGWPASGWTVPTSAQWEWGLTQGLAIRNNLHVRPKKNQNNMCVCTDFTQGFRHSNLDSNPSPGWWWWSSSGQCRYWPHERILGTRDYSSAGVFLSAVKELSSCHTKGCDSLS